jgi:hypothetical protein
MTNKKTAPKAALYSKPDDQAAINAGFDFDDTP